MKREKFYIILIFILLSAIGLIKNYSGSEFFENFKGKGELEFITQAGTHYENLSPDAFAYIAGIEYLRGNADQSVLSAPFAYRVLPLWLASLLPDSVPPRAALDIVNLAFLYLGLFYLYLILKKSKVSYNLIILALLLYVVSFPVFYYGMSGLIDPVAIGLLYAILYFSNTATHSSGSIATKNNIIVCILLFLAGLTKESLIVVIPVLGLIDYRLTRKKIRSVSNTVIYSAIFIMAYLIARNILPVSSGYGWAISLDTIIGNLARPRMYFSTFLTFGIPGFIALYSIIRNIVSNDFRVEFSKMSPYIVGYIGTIALWLYSIASAYTDGRFIWYMYPFAIILTINFFEELKKEKELPENTGKINF